MAARTSWNPRSERAPDYLDDDALNPAYDDLLDAGFDEYGRLTRRRPVRGYQDDPRQDELRRAVDSLARQVDAATRQAGRARMPAQQDERTQGERAQGARPLDALDRLEARLDALHEEAQQRNHDQSGRPDLAGQLAAHSDAERAKMEAQLEHHFAAMDQRIAALHDLARGKNVDSIRDDLATIGDRIEGIASSGHSVSGSIERVHEQLGELRHRLESEGWNGANTLTAMQDRLDLITEKLAQLELTPSALSAVERGYSHILERVSRIEQLAGQNVAANDLWDRLDALRDQIGGMQSNEGLASLETRIAGLAENIETLSSHRGHDPAFDRVEMKLADMARTIAIIRDRRDMHSGAIEARLADITARIDKVGQDRGRIDFTPVEKQIASLTSRIDQIGSREPEFDVSGMERQFADLGGRIEEMLNRPAPVADDRPAFDTIETRLSELQSRLEEVYAVAGQAQPAADPSEALGGIDKRLTELHGRLDDLTLATGVDPTDLTPIASRLDTIDGRLDNVAESATSSMSVGLATLSDKINMIDEQLRMMAPSNPDLPVLLERFGALESQIETAAGKTAKVDFSPLTSQIAALDQHLRDHQPSGEVDLQPVSARLQGIENRLEDLTTSFPTETRSLNDRLEAIDRRFDQLSTAGAPDLSPLNDQLVEIDRQLRGLALSGASAALDWSPITERLDAMDGRLSEYQPGQSPDLTGLQDTLATIDERLDRMAGAEPAAFAAAGMEMPSLDVEPLTERLQAIEERLSALAVGSPDAGIDISPVTERLQAIEQRLEGLQATGGGETQEDDRLMPLLETFEAALRKISTSDDIAALADKVGGLHTALDSAGEGSALDEMADLRNDITYLRRELRSMPMMTESEDGSGGLGTLLAEIKDRLDRIPSEQTVSEDGGATTAAVVASIENSISELKHANAVSDDDTRQTLDALKNTMEAIVGRMAYLETGAVAAAAVMPVAEAAYQADEEPQYEPEASEPAFDEPIGADEIPEISIGAEPAEQVYDTPAEEAAAELQQAYEEPAPEATEPQQAYEEPAPEAAEPQQAYEEPVAEAEENALPAAEEAAPEELYETPSYETPAYETPAYEAPAYDAVEPAAETLEQPIYDAPEQGYETLEQADDSAETVADEPAEPVFDTAVQEEAPGESEADLHPQQEMDQMLDTAVDDLTADEAVELSEQTAAPDTGSQSILGRLTSSQILKRATGGRAESFTPETEDQPEGGSETLLEPGTDAPMDSSLHDAPSSDTAVMSGEGPESRTRQGAGLGDLAAASGLGLDQNGPKDDKGNQFLSAARRAARAAVLEASQVDPGSAGNSKAVRSTTKKRRSLTALILAIALVALLAFLGYKYWRGELSFEGISIGGFSLTQSAPMDDGEQMSAADRPGMDVAGADTLMMPDTAASNEPVELKPISPDSTIAFGAPEASSGLSQSGGTISGFLASVVQDLPMSAGAVNADAETGMVVAASDTVGSIASVTEPAPKTDAATPTAKGDLAKRTEEIVAAALAGAKVRTASLPKAGTAVSVLPSSIGTTGLRQAALADIPEAQFEIASRFADGSGVKSDVKTAAIWYEKAARKGLAPAQFRLGSLYEKGKGVPLDRARAEQLYHAAAETGNAKAMHNLAVLHAEGGAGEPDLVKAGKWFQMAAEHGVRDSQFNIGILHARGLGIPKNFVEAYKWFAIAAKSGDDQAAKRRDTIAASMNQEDLARALAAANIFQPIPLRPEANLVIEPRGGWAAAAIDISPSGAELIGRIQTMLTRRGFDPGPADGVIGRRTTGAIEAFQMEAGLPITGKPDLEVLSALQSGAI